MLQHIWNKLNKHIILFSPIMIQQWWMMCTPFFTLSSPITFFFILIWRKNARCTTMSKTGGVERLTGQGRSGSANESRSLRVSTCRHVMLCWQLNRLLLRFSWYYLPAESIFWSSSTCCCCSGGNELSCSGVSCNTCCRRADSTSGVSCTRTAGIF